METWAEMTYRHKRERVALVEELAALGITQTEAARRLETSVQNLNAVIRAKGINWPTAGTPGRKRKSA